MTRFARAKGAAGSNPRVEEEATPWHEMVAQMKKASSASADIEDLDCFEETGPSAAADNVDVESDGDRKFKGDQVKVEEAPAKGPESIAKSEGSEPADKGSKKQRKRSQDKCLNCKQKGHLKRECPDLSEERRSELQELVRLKQERKGHGVGRKKNKRKPEEPAVQLQSSTSATNQNKKPKVEKLDLSGQVVREDEGLYQGFRVKQQDVVRLKKMEQEMRRSGNMTEDELAQAMKRERRKAERELAKFRKMVCYQCRQPGHQLSECPDREIVAAPETTVESTTNVCFKCGGCGHTSKTCTVSKLKGADAYKFATCFICKETGHLAKACPDNPKGLYPKGGGCRFCGSVEHLKADCPRKSQKDARQEVKLQLAKKSMGVEEMPEEIQSRRATVAESIASKKVVTF